MNNSKENLLLLSKLLYSSGRLYVWAFDSKAQFINTNCPYEELLLEVFPTDKYNSVLQDFCSSSQSPYIVGSSLGISFGLVHANHPDPETAASIFLIGPLFFEQPNETDIAEFVHSTAYSEYSEQWYQDVYKMIISMPVMDINLFKQEVVKFHSLVNNNFDETHVIYRLARPERGVIPANTSDTLRTTYSHEQVLLNIIRTGDPNLATAAHEAILQSFLIGLINTAPLFRAKEVVLSLLVLVSRAAVDGGMSVTDAFTYADSIVPLIENAVDHAELRDIATHYYNDYLSKVHAVKTNPSYSTLVQRTIDYIDQHLGHKILASDIAQFLGYNEYYLTKKFKEETGVYINEYMKQQKVKRAQHILLTTDMKIQDISELLGFSTCNYFCTCFRNVVGKSPQEYRIQSETSKNRV